jgi:cytoskeleton protein RodZ
MAEGLHIAALAVTLKVPVKKIEALEADRLDELPDMVFVRALASSICRTLRVAPGPVLDRLPPSNLPSLGADATSLNASYRVRGDRSGWALWERLSRPYGLAILALILGVAAMVVLPFRPPTDAPVSQSPEAETAPPAAAMPSAPVAPATVTLVPEAAIAAPALALPSAPSDLGAKAIVAGSGALTGVLVLQARGASWVEVTDAKGVVQVRKIMNQGDVLGISGPLPLAVVLGRAEVVDVLVRGTPLDIQAATKDKVARFEVK